MELRPSEVFYSQDSILNKFGDYTFHGNTFIGETLDQLLSGYCNVNNIPKINVVKRYGKWFTTDNRRLWVFRKAEELGFLNTIEVVVTSYLNENKFTTENGGTSIRVRGRGPGGSLWKTWKPKRQNSAFGRSRYRNDMISPDISRTPSPLSQQKTNVYNQNYYITPTRSVVSPRQNYTSSHFGSEGTHYNTNVVNISSYNLPTYTTPSRSTNRNDGDTFRFNSSVESRQTMSPALQMNETRHTNTETLNDIGRQDRILSPSTGRSYTRHSFRDGFQDVEQVGHVSPSLRSFSGTRHNDEKQKGCCIIL